MTLRELLNLDEKGFARMAIQVSGDLDRPYRKTRVIAYLLIHGRGGRRTT
jgi:hypothetical protein